MPLLTLRDVTFGFGGPPLLQSVSVAIEAGERVALVGRNGAGKSTLLRLLEGELPPDAGEIRRDPGLTIAGLIQTVPSEMSGTVFETVAGGLGGLGEAVAAHHRLSVSPPATAAESGELESAEEAIHEADGWSLFRRTETVISRLGLEPDVDVEPLSAGVRRRVLLGRVLVREPGLLLLDEPTNHLDIDSIRWLEGFLSTFGGALLFITHDRVFLETVASRILELDRGRIRSYSCGWDRYLERRQDELDAEAEQQRVFDRKLAREEVWIRKGVKERRKRNMGRVRELQKMRRERQARREKLGSVRLVSQEAERSGRLVIEALDVLFAYGDQTVIRDFSATVQRGDRVGLLGPNGSGKTTLLRLLLGELSPDGGSIRHGTNLEIAYFDQLHATLDEEKTVVENLSDGADMLMVGGRSRHVVSYLDDFLFSPLHARSPVKTLSGGERNRLLLAKLFARPSNVLALDEPTNDLDADTLELLEELLLGYKGSVLVVSHDRAFLDHVVTSTLVVEDTGRVKEYVGGYSDWVRQTTIEPLVTSRAGRSTPTAALAKATEDRPRRLTYLEKRELEELPARIEKLEGRKQQILDAMVSPGFYERARSAVDEASEELAGIEVRLGEAYRRWEELEERGDG